MSAQRWTCSHCGATGFGYGIPAHDKPSGVSCRKSGQRPESELRSAHDKLISDAMQAAMDWIYLIGPNTPPDKQPALIEKLKECQAIHASASAKDL